MAAAHEITEAAFPFTREGHRKLLAKAIALNRKNKHAWYMFFEQMEAVQGAPGHRSCEPSSAIGRDARRNPQAIPTARTAARPLVRVPSLLQGSEGIGDQPEAREFHEAPLLRPSSLWQLRCDTEGA